MSSYIREANQEDILEVVRLLRLFTKQTTLSPANIKDFSPRAVSGMVHYSLNNGLCVVAVKKLEDGREQLIGVIMGAISVNPWTDFRRELREIAWYVNPKYRDSRVGLKMYKRYKDVSREMIEDELIFCSHMVTLESSSASTERLVSRDFNKIESHYIMEV
jgi:hypothetical protein